MDRERRYKQRGLNFISAEDSRALRAVDSRVGRKAKRDAILGNRRKDVLNSSTTHLVKKESSSHNKTGLVDTSLSGAIPKLSERELGLQRYQELLKWRGQRRKKLDVEKRQRKPSFKTGLYQPDQARFLVSDDVDKIKQDSDKNTPSKATPFKYLQRSSTKYGFTPGASTKKIPRFCSGITPNPALAKVPKFNLRTTPNMSLGRVALLQHRRTVDHKENVPSNSNIVAPHKEKDVKLQKRMKAKSAHGGTDMKRILRGRAARHQEALRGNEDLGVIALPATPVVDRPRRNRKSSIQPTSTSSEEDVTMEVVGSVGAPSFAPQNFAFNFSVSKPNESPKNAYDELKTISADNVSRTKDNTPRVGRYTRSRYSQSGDSDSLNESKDLEGHRLTEENFKYGESDNYDTVEESELDSQEEKTEDDDESQEEAKTEDEKMKDVVGDVSDHNEIIFADKGVTEIREESETDYYNEDTGDENIDEGGETMEEKATMRHSTTVDTKCESVSERTNRFESTKAEVVQKEDVVFEDNDASHFRVADDELCNMSVQKDTPMAVNRRSTRRSTRLSSCMGSTLTPLMAKLRPRTPCSRSTRRSMEAHTDFDPDRIYTPRAHTSARKSIRRSRRQQIKDADELPIPFWMDDVQSDNVGLPSKTPVKEDLMDLSQHDVIEEESEEEPIVRKADLATPKESKGDQAVKTPIQNSFVTPRNSKERRKVSWIVKESPYINSESRSAKSRRSVIPEDLKTLFDDIPTDGSPLPEYLTPLVNKCRIDRGQSPILYIGSDEKKVPSPSDDITTSPPIEGDETCSNLLELLKPSTPSVRNETPDIDVWGDESFDKADDLLPSLKPTNTDAVVPTIPVPKVTRRSSRVSLLPVLGDTPGADRKLSVVTEDLISWETPMLPLKTTAIMSKEKPVATPSRRSRRISRAVLPE